MSTATKQRQRCPEHAHDAINVLTETGFVDLERASDAVLARLAGDDPVAALTVGDWIDVIRASTGIDLTSLQAATRPWRNVRETLIPRAYPQGMVLERAHFGCADHSTYYAAAYAAHRVLEAEEGFLKKDLMRVWRQLLRSVDEHAFWKGRSRMSAFDWYVVSVGELNAQSCRNRRGAEVQP